MGLIQRVLDEHGLPTISITQVAEIAAVIKPSRSIFVPHPFGLTFGDLNDTATQHDVLEAMFTAAESMDWSGIKGTDFRWTKDNRREKQLRKQRH